MFHNDDFPNKKRATFSTFKDTFDNIGHVMDITNDPEVIPKVIDIMRKSALCNSKG